MNKFLSILFALCLSVSALGLTPAERVIVEKVGEANKTLKANAKITDSKLVWATTELAHKQVEIDHVVQERDQYQSWYNAAHEAELKQAAHILKLYIVIGVMTLLMGAYAIAKFWFHLPI